jgi:hypothetical protein
MPQSRILLLGVLPRFDVHTLGVPWTVFENQVQVMGMPYDKGLEQVRLGRAAILQYFEENNLSLDLGTLFGIGTDLGIG